MAEQDDKGSAERRAMRAYLTALHRNEAPVRVRSVGCTYVVVPDGYEWVVERIVDEVPPQSGDLRPSAWTRPFLRPPRSPPGTGTAGHHGPGDPGHPVGGGRRPRLAGSAASGPRARRPPCPLERASRAAKGAQIMATQPAKKAAAKKAPARKASPAAVAVVAPTKDGGAEVTVGTERSPFPPPEDKPAKAEPKRAPDPDRQAAADKAKATRAAAEASGVTQKCEGTCGQTKAITAFPTTGLKKDGTMGRAKVCRACRDAGKSNK